MESSETKQVEDDKLEVADPKKKQSVNLLDFSDCVLTLIFSYLRSYDLYYLSKTCQRFKYLVEERRLWRNVDISEHPMCTKKYEFFYDNINSLTRTLRMSGICRKEKTMTTRHFKNIMSLCHNLTVLAIESQYINTDEIRMCQFPVTLQELSLRGTHVAGTQPFFQDAHKTLVNLHTLILAECKWFHEHSLMALSKLPSLENLSLYNCLNLQDSVAYMSITARFGFPKLVRIDARRTPIGDQFLKCFHCIKTLREIYLESPPSDRPFRRCNIFDELQKWCSSNDTTGSNIVIFNSNNVNVMKYRHTGEALKKSLKKSLKPTSSEYRERSCDRYDCTEENNRCSIETCSFIMNLSEEEISISSLANAKWNKIKQDNRNSFMMHLFDDDDVEETEAEGIINESMEEGSKEEQMYTDDVSDTDDESIYESIFQADITDSGIQWFYTSNPEEVDDRGHESVLFRKPHRECVCYGLRQEPDPNVAGPSGLQKSALRSRSQDAHPRSISSSPDSSPDRRRAPKRKSGDVSTKSSKQRRVSKSSITVDIRKGPVHLEIINDAKNKDLLTMDDSSSSGSESEDVAIPRASPSAPEYIQEQIQGAARDLRVVIERIDPGLHIVIDRAGRIQLGPIFRNNFTKLKVFMARGYKHVTDVALRSLSDLHLELLDVAGTSVTAAAVQEFLMLNPDCRVIHESICHCYHD